MCSLRFLLLTSPPFLICFPPWGSSHCTSDLFLSSGQGVWEVVWPQPARSTNPISCLVLSTRAAEWVDALWHCTKLSVPLISWLKKWVNGEGFWLNVYVPKLVVVSTSQGLDQELDVLDAQFLPPGTACHPLVWGWTFHLCDTFQPCVHFCYFCSSAPLRPRQPPQARTEPCCKSVLQPFISQAQAYFGVLNVQGFSWGLGGELGGVIRTVCRSSLFSSWWWRSKLPAHPPSRGIWASSWSQVHCVRQCSGAISALPPRHRGTNFCHECCGGQKRKLVHKAMGQDTWDGLPCAAEVPATSLPSLGGVGEFLGACRGGRWGIWGVVGSCLMLFSMQEESVQSLLACAPKNSASVWTVFTTWLWKLPPGSWWWTLGELS